MFEETSKTELERFYEFELPLQAMTHLFWVCFLVSMLAAAVACTRSRNEAQQQTAVFHPSNPVASDPESLAFDIVAVKTTDGAQGWLGSYESKGKKALFRIELGPADVPATKGPFAFGKGSFVADPRSDASVLLTDLRKVLAAKTTPTKVERSTTLPFTFVNLGEGMSRGPGGGFSEKPAGSWRPMKIFFESGGQEGEVYLNLNPEIGKAEFSIKDEDYGDFVVAQLAKVL
jgi:hypothetical protein